MNGLLVIDKPGGITSHDVVSRLRKITGERSIGHLGTLDPMATGVLPLLLGKFTRLAQYFSSAEKSYTGTIRFGFATDTYDADGDAVGQQTPSIVDAGTVRAAASRFRGEMEQMPPPFSAKKIAGTPAYKMARAGKPVELKPAEIIIRSFEITALDGDEASFAMSVSAGGYVRSVAHELGQDLGCGAHLSSLRRTQAGVFTLADAHRLEELEPLAGNVDALERSACIREACFPRCPLSPAMLSRWAVCATERRQICRSFPSADGEGVCGPARTGRHCKARCGNAVSAGRGDGLDPAGR